MIVRLARRKRFFAAHRLYRPELDEAANAAIYGKCSHPSGHGHTYTVTAVVEGEAPPPTCMVCDLATLDALLDEAIATLAWKRIDQEVPYFRNHRASSEEILGFLWRHLEPLVRSRLGVRLARLELAETRNNHFEIQAPPDTEGKAA